MFIMYVDESGDCGLSGSPSRYFILTGIIIHESAWNHCLTSFINFRGRMRGTYGLKVRDEIHAFEFMRKGGHLSSIPRSLRIAIIRAFIKEIASNQQLDIISIALDKQGKPPTYDVFYTAWSTLIQRFENTLRAGNFTGGKQMSDHGIIICDRTNTQKLRSLQRKMRRINLVPSKFSGNPPRNLPLIRVIEDPFDRDSQDSYFIQACDNVAYALKQHLDPNKKLKKKGVHNYFNMLSPRICRHANSGAKAYIAL